MNLVESFNKMELVEYFEYEGDLLYWYYEGEVNVKCGDDEMCSVYECSEVWNMV
jgi:hypothetical protein